MLLGIGLIFLFGLFASILFQRLRLPGLLGMLLAGILLGPYGLNWVDSTTLSISAELRQMALVFILLRAGLSLRLSDFQQVGRPAVLLCFVPAIFEIGAMLFLAPILLGISLTEAAVLGAVIGAVSPAVIVPKMLRLMEQGWGTDKKIPQMILAGASADDVFVLVLFSAFTGLAAGQSFSLLTFLDIPLSIFFGILAGATAGILAARLLPRLPVSNSGKLIYLLGCAFLLTSAETLLKNKLPFSGLLAVMAMGIFFCRKAPDTAEIFTQKLGALWSGAEILLFVLVGTAVNLPYLGAAGSNAVLLLFLALLFRCCGVLLCLLGAGFSLKEMLFCAVAYLPKATVQAAIGAVPLAMGLSCGSLVLAVAVLSILLTAPLGAIGIELLYPVCLKQKRT